MPSLLTQVTVVPGTTVISPGMKVLWSMVTVATGPAPALFASSARHGADARTVNRTVSLNARRTLCALQPACEDVLEFAKTRIGSRTVTTNLLVWVEAICRRRTDHRTPAERRIKMAVAQLRLLRIERALSVTEDSPSRDEIPEFVHIFFIESRLLWPAK